MDGDGLAVGGDGSEGTAASADLARLRRWEEAGGTWRVLAHGPGSATVVLCRCDGGEEAERFRTTDPALLAFLADHRRAD